jgi:hypothetical protein
MTIIAPDVLIYYAAVNAVVRPVDIDSIVGSYRYDGARVESCVPVMLPVPITVVVALRLRGSDNGED